MRDHSSVRVRWIVIRSTLKEFAWHGWVFVKRITGDLVIPNATQRDRRTKLKEHSLGSLVLNSKRTPAIFLEALGHRRDTRGSSDTQRDWGLSIG